MFDNHFLFLSELTHSVGFELLALIPGIGSML